MRLVLSMLVGVCVIAMVLIPAYALGEDIPMEQSQEQSNSQPVESVPELSSAASSTSVPASSSMSSTVSSAEESSVPVSEGSNSVVSSNESAASGTTSSEASTSSIPQLPAIEPMDPPIGEASLLESVQRIDRNLDLLVNVLIPLGVAILVIWLLGMWFYNTFIKGVL